MFTISHKKLSQNSLSQGVRFQPSGGPAAAPDEQKKKNTGPSVDDLLKQAREKLEAAKSNPYEGYVRNEVYGSYFATDSVRHILLKVLEMNQAKRAEILALIDTSAGQPEWQTPANQKIIMELKASFVAEEKQVEKEQEVVKVPSVAKGKAEVAGVKQEIIYNLPIVKDYAQKINLGSALALVSAQSGSSVSEQAKAAIKAIKDSGVYYNASSEDAVKELKGYTFREELGDLGTKRNEARNSARAIESGDLMAFLEKLTTAPESAQKALLKGEITPDTKVDPKNMADLIADFDDDGILEAINGLDTSTWSKWFFSLFGSADAMQTQFFGESQLRKILEKNLPVIIKYLNDKGVRRPANESDKSWAKRVRTAITVQADMFGTGAIGAGGAEKMYVGAGGKRNLDERNKISQIFTAVEKTLKENEKIKPADVSRVAGEVTDWIVRTQFSLGAGEINLNELTKIVSDPKDASLLSMDYTAMIRLFNSPRLKLNGSLGAGAGLVGGDLIPFAHIGANAKLTFADRGELETLMKNIEEGKGNITTTLGANFVTKMKGPAVNVDLLWKDRIDQSENAVTHMGAVIDSMLTLDAEGNPSLELSRITDKKMDQSMRDILALLDAALVDGSKDLKTLQEKMAHAALLRNKFLNAFELYVNNHPKMKGVGLAGITFIAIPGALGFGPVFQNVGTTRTAREVTQSQTKPIAANEINSTLASHGLSYNKDAGVLTISADADRSKVKLPADMSFDTNGAVNLGKDKSPKFSVDATGVVTITLTDGTKTSTTTSTPARVEILQKEVDLPKGVLDSIRALPINKLIERADVKAFMLAMTKGDFQSAIRSALSIKEFAPIIKSANVGRTDPEKKQFIQNALLEIDEKLVGDQVTRLFNDAKTDAKAFERYKALLKSRGVNVSKLTREDMTVGDIAKASFDKPGLRDQELDLIAKVSGLNINSLRIYDRELLNNLMGEKKQLNTIGLGLMLMARNRAAKGLQGARQYDTGSYISKKLINLSTDQHLAVATKMLGDDFRKMALLNIANRKEFSAYANEIMATEAKIVNGKITIALSGNKSLTIDLTETKVSSALYGDTSMTNKGQGQAVCINCALLVEPKVSAVLTGEEGGTIAVPSMEVTTTESQIVFDGEAFASQASIVAYRAQGGKGGDSGSEPGDGDGKSGSLPGDKGVTKIDPNAQGSPSVNSSTAGAVDYTIGSGVKLGSRGNTPSQNPPTSSNNSGAVSGTTDGGTAPGIRGDGATSLYGAGVTIDLGKIKPGQDKTKEESKSDERG